MYNLICLCSFVLMILTGKLLDKTSKQDLILRTVSTILFIYKTYFYISQNLKGNVAIPVEISNISYYLLFIIIVFRIKKLYCVGAFFGIMAGIGYFAFYSFLGFTVAESFTLKDILIGCFSHGYLLVSGLYLFKNNVFENKEKFYIWITLLAMICWALIFYDVQMRGITFIYYIIKPEFLFVSQVFSLNVILIMLYYLILIFAVLGVIKLFFDINLKRKNNDGMLITY